MLGLQIDDEPRFFRWGSFLEATVGRDRDIFCYTVLRSFHSLHWHTEASICLISAIVKPIFRR